MQCTRLHILASCKPIAWKSSPPYLIPARQYGAICCRVAEAAASAALAGATGAQVSMLRCDTGMASEAASALATAAGLPPVAGIMNSGGILQDALITAQTAASLRAVFAPKLVSAAAMQEAAAGQPVHQVLMFSSAASLFGAPGQANYAAANAALEGWAAGTAATGVNGIAIQWGAWAAGALACSACSACSASNADPGLTR